MEYGRLRAPRPELAVLVCVLVALGLASCGGALEKTRASAFEAALVSLDSLLAAQSPPALDRAFAGACKLARAVPDWLSLLKLARKAQSLGSGGLYAHTADLARAAFPNSESLAAAAAHAYLRNGRPVEAFALFRALMAPETRPSLWAEAFVASRGSGARPSDYGRYEEISGEPRAFLGAAAAALEGGAAGDRIAARAWLEKGLAAGALAPPELLWDCGLHEALAGGSDAASGSAELALMGDAAWMAGDPVLARRRWERSISLAPRRSWKPYAKLALMAGDSEAAGSYWGRMRAAFLSGPASPERDGALESYSAYLVRGGREAEALALLRGQGPAAGGRAGSGLLKVMAVTLVDRGRPEGRFDADLEALAAELPHDGEVMGAVFRSLFIRERYGELAILREQAARNGTALRYGWYYDAAVRAARGGFKAAAAGIAAAGEGSCGWYALGSLRAAMGDAAKSVDAFSQAADSARGGRERCAAFKALGRALVESGDQGRAARAFASAVSADPSDAEAAILARVQGTKK